MLSSEQIWNPWRGCRKTYAGCEHCWMFFLSSQRKVDPTLIKKNVGAWTAPLDKKRNGDYRISSNTILNVCLTSDFFLENVPDEWREHVWSIIARRTDVGFVILTKRAYRIEECLPDDWGNGYPNVTLAVTVENQEAANTRLPYLVSIPATRKRIMCEPLLERIDISAYIKTGEIDEVLCGGENYAGARICRLEWVRDLSEQCKHAGVKFIFFDTGSDFIDDDGNRYQEQDSRKRRVRAQSYEINVDSYECYKHELLLKTHPLDDVFDGERLFDI